MCPLTGDWDKAEEVLKRLSENCGKGMGRGLALAAMALARVWKIGITSGKFGLKANAQITVIGKGSSRPLVNHDDLVRSIRHGRVGPLAYAVGISRNAKGRDGQALVDLAALHERGGVIRRRRAKALAIPVTKKAERAGSPRDFPGELAFIPAKNKRGNFRGFLVEKNRSTRKMQWRDMRGQKGLVHYVLVLRVKIPARPHRAKAYEIWLKSKPQHVIAQEIQKEVRKSAS